MRYKVKRGIDPVQERHQIKAEQQREKHGRFRVVALEWYGKNANSWAPTYASTVLGRLERYVFPELGEVPLSEISAQDILTLTERIEGAGIPETARRVLGLMGQVFTYGLIKGLCDRNPCLGLHKALKPKRVQHMAAPLDPKRIAEILRQFDAYEGGVIVKTAMQLGPLLAVRPGELRGMRWQDLDLDQPQWTRVISKVDQPLITPLPTQAMALIKGVGAYTAHSPWVLPSPRDWRRPMSSNAVRAAIRALGIEGDEPTEHGWRSVFRTHADEVLKVRIEVIEMALGHTVRDSLGRAYNRTSYLDERRELAQRWADYLDSLKQL